MVEVRIYTDKILIAYKDSIIGEHQRCFEKHQRIYNPWHYVAALEYKPGALRNGAPFKNWSLPAALTTIHKKLRAYPDGDKQFIQLLLQVVKIGLDKVNQACQAALDQGPSSVDFIIHYLAQQQAEAIIGQTPLVNVREFPLAQCDVYDNVLLTCSLVTGQEDKHVA